MGHIFFTQSINRIYTQSNSTDSIKMRCIRYFLLWWTWSVAVNADTAVAEPPQTKTKHKRKSSNTTAAQLSNFSTPTDIIPILDPTTSSMFGVPIRFDDATAMDVATRIVGGSKALSTEAPFFTLLITWDETEGVWKNMGCGGSVVSNRHVLTSAHCLEGRKDTIDAVFINAYDPFRGNPSVPYHFSRIRSYHVHPDHNDRTNANDVAIITLRRRIKDTVSFPAVRLLPPQQAIVNGQEARIYGFGRRMDTDTAPVETLRAVSIPFISNEACRQYYPYHLLPDMICAGVPHRQVGEERRDACTGDSGGPMTIHGDDSNGDDTVVYQMGIVSWGEGCGKSRKPGVYSSIQYHYSWIQGMVCDDTTGGTASFLCEPEQLDLPTSLVSSSRTAATATTVTCGDGNLKSVGTSCSYGGECCSGICTSSSFFYKRVCQEQETLDTSSRRSSRQLRRRHRLATVA